MAKSVGGSPHHENELAAQMTPLAQLVRGWRFGKLKQPNFRYAHGTFIPERKDAFEVLAVPLNIRPQGAGRRRGSAWAPSAPKQ